MPGGSRRDISEKVCHAAGVKHIERNSRSHQASYVCCFASAAITARIVGRTRRPRERKKRGPAHRLSAPRRGCPERGYQGTTVADIAAAADIAPRTFFAFLASKEAVVFDQVDEDVTSLARALRERGEGENAMDTLRRWIRSSSGAGTMRPAPTWRGASVCVAREPTLAQFDLAVMSRSRSCCAKPWRSTRASPPTACGPELVAAAATAALGALEGSLDEASSSRGSPPRTRRWGCSMRRSCPARRRRGAAGPGARSPWLSRPRAPEPARRARSRRGPSGAAWHRRRRRESGRDPSSGRRTARARPSAPRPPAASAVRSTAPPAARRVTRHRVCGAAR